MKRITVTLALAGLLAAAPMAASAAECVTEFATLQQLTTDADIIGKNAEKDRTGLSGKLTEAARKLDSGKTEDAAQKVSDYQSKLLQLLNGGKIDQATFDTLNAGAVDLQDCIAEVGN